MAKIKNVQVEMPIDWKLNNELSEECQWIGN